MPAAGGPLHPTRNDDHVLDATFELQAVPVFDLVYHHKVGGERAINADYHEGLELLLSRIASVGAAILGVSVDSGVARELEPDQRELPLDFPIEIDQSVDARELRLEITRAVRAIARRPDAKPGGGNDQKRIKITFTLDRTVTPHEAEELLIDGTRPTDREPAPVEHPKTLPVDAPVAELSATNRQLLAAVTTRLQTLFPHLWGSQRPATDSVIGYLANEFLSGDAGPRPFTKPDRRQVEEERPTPPQANPSTPRPPTGAAAATDGVLVLARGNGRLRGTWHRPGYEGCPGRQALRVNHPDADYTVVPLADAEAQGIKRCSFCARYDRGIGVPSPDDRPTRR